MGFHQLQQPKQKKLQRLNKILITFKEASHPEWRRLAFLCLNLSSAYG